jgi:molybdate transport system substrate-binding protein
VYASDAVGVKNVRVLFEVPQKLYPTITYPAAVIAGSPSATEARAVLQWLRGPEARAAFRQAGFMVKAPPTSSTAESGDMGGAP